MEEGATATGLPVLARTLSRLARLESDFEAALEEAKLQAMYKLAAGAGHEINNPLGSIAGRAQLLLRDESDPERRRTLAKINSQAFRAHEMIADMMLFARPPLPQFDQIAPATLIQSLVDEMHEITEQQEAEIVSHVTTDIATMRVDASQLRVALRAMCTNALEATGLGGRVEIRVSDGPSDKVLHKKSGAGQTVQITVCDNGPGFSDEERQHLFDPFYSGREAGRGLGFGLSKCWRIVRNHGGRIDVQSDPGRGATFEITLPVA
jgi:signal transduction histidine kinase